jgi:hypothetical protein
MKERSGDPNVECGTGIIKHAADQIIRKSVARVIRVSGDQI